MQALGLVTYCGLVVSFMWNVEKWFKTIPEYFTPFLFLTVFSTSALICALITLYYPFVLFWQKKQVNRALKLVVLTAGWLVVFVLAIFLLLFNIR